MRADQSLTQEQADAIVECGSQLLELYDQGKIDVEEYVTVMNSLGACIDLETFIAAEAERKA